MQVSIFCLQLPTSLNDSVQLQQSKERAALAAALKQQQQQGCKATLQKGRSKQTSSIATAATGSCTDSDCGIGVRLQGQDVLKPTHRQAQVQQPGLSS
jgi:aconitase A